MMSSPSPLPHSSCSSSSRANNKSVRICIVGAGLAGSMMAILLAKLGYRVSVYEKREDPRVVCCLFLSPSLPLALFIEDCLE